MKKTQFVSELCEGEKVDDLFSVKYKKPPREYSKGYMFEVRVTDRTGEINLKYWGSRNRSSVQNVYDPIAPGEVVRVRGRVSEYRDTLEIAVSDNGEDGIQPVDRSAYNIRDFLGSTEKDVDQMMSKLFSRIRQVENEHLSKLLMEFFADDDFVKRFKNAPASMHLHCNWLGGLLEHTLNVVNICDFLYGLHEKMDRDLLITGAILHDIGKLEEYTLSTNIDVSIDGMLRGHLVIGAEMVNRKCDELQGFPELLKMKLAHIILSSHGQTDYGAVKEPQFPEALAVSQADNVEAKLEQYISKKEDARTEDPWIYDKRLGHIFLL